MKRTAQRIFSAVLILAFLEPLIPPVIPPEWAYISPMEWSPEEWPDLETQQISEPQGIDPAETAGLKQLRILNDEIGLQARFQLLPGEGALNDGIVAAVRRALTEQEQRSQSRYTPQVHAVGAGLQHRGCLQGSSIIPVESLLEEPAIAPPGGIGTAITCDVVAAHGPFFGQRLRTVVADEDGVVSDASTLVYTDMHSGEIFLPYEIWNENAPAVVWNAAIELLRRQAGSLSLAQLHSDPDPEIIAEALESTVIAPDGSLAVTLPEGIISVELKNLGLEPTDTSLTIALPLSVTEGITSEIGARLAQAAATAATFDPPPQLWAGNEKVNCALVPCVALTYDDGPSLNTPEILDELAVRGASATFFVIGNKIQDHSAVVARTAAEGHTVANHSWSHKDLTELTEKEIKKELTRTNEAIQQATGSPSVVFRPPYGAVNKKVLDAAKMPAILWDVDTNDWKEESDEALIEHAVTKAQPGSIVLQHDVHNNTARTVGPVLDGLLGRGFVLVNLNQLFDDSLPTSGKITSAR